MFHEQPPIPAGAIFQPPFGRILPDVFHFLFQLPGMPDDVVEALDQPDATLTPKHLIDLPG
jgi:hypothetical protein